MHAWFSEGLYSCRSEDANIVSDPCTPERGACSDKENCTPNGHSAVCTCKNGYKRVKGVCIVSDPCATGVHDCDINAYCERIQGREYKCHCYKNFIGNGRVCVGKSLLTPLRLCLSNKIVFVDVQMQGSVIKMLTVTMANALAIADMSEAELFAAN